MFRLIPFGSFRPFKAMNRNILCKIAYMDFGSWHFGSKLKWAERTSMISLTLIRLTLYPLRGGIPLDRNPPRGAIPGEENFRNTRAPAPPLCSEAKGSPSADRLRIHPGDPHRLTRARFTRWSV
jgi:hypothetical protein